MFEMLLVLAGAAVGVALLVALGYGLAWAVLHGRRDGPGWERLDGFRYAHRGLHGCGVPENSLAAFRRAAEAGYGAELDVRLTKDGRLAVIHDATLDRVCGVSGRAAELTAAALSALRLEAGTPDRGAEDRLAQRRGPCPQDGGMPGPLLHRLLRGELRPAAAAVAAPPSAGCAAGAAVSEFSPPSVGPGALESAGADESVL